jgi:uncharacterized iron-regulated membrane protein
VYLDKDLFYNADNLYFDQYTAKQIPVSYWGKYADANAGEKATRMNYDIHIGAIAGLPGRILMFFAALITASLPVTGFYIWWGKKKKKSSRYKYREEELVPGNHINSNNIDQLHVAINC